MENNIKYLFLFLFFRKSIIEEEYRAIAEQKEKHRLQPRKSPNFDVLGFLLL